MLLEYVIVFKAFCVDMMFLALNNPSPKNPETFRRHRMFSGLTRIIPEKRSFIVNPARNP
jgi:hypothetical protein